MKLISLVIIIHHLLLVRIRMVTRIQSKNNRMKVAQKVLEVVEVVEVEVGRIGVEEMVERLLINVDKEAMIEKCQKLLNSFSQFKVELPFFMSC